jgi:hypothetical protein
MSVPSCRPVIIFPEPHNTTDSTHSVISVSQLKKDGITDIFVTCTAFLEIIVDRPYTLHTLVHSNNIFYVSEKTNQSKLYLENECIVPSKEPIGMHYDALLHQLGSLIVKTKTPHSGMTIRDLISMRGNDFFVPEGLTCRLETNKTVQLQSLVLSGDLSNEKKLIIHPQFFCHPKGKKCPDFIIPNHRITYDTENKKNPITAVIDCMNSIANLLRG